MINAVDIVIRKVNYKYHIIYGRGFEQTSPNNEFIEETSVAANEFCRSVSTLLAMDSRERGSPSNGDSTQDSSRMITVKVKQGEEADSRILTLAKRGQRRSDKG